MHTTLMYDKLFKCTWTTVVSISTVVAVREKRRTRRKGDGRHIIIDGSTI